MPENINVEPLTTAAFAPFGDIVAVSGDPDRIINGGRCGRWHDLARLICAPGGRLGVSLFRSQACKLPMMLQAVERHQLGSQTFLPLQPLPWLAIVCPDDNGRPGPPRAFLATSKEGINYHPGTWHAVLTPLAEPALFAVIDRIAAEVDVEEHTFDEPYLVVSAER